jgi:outer membrane protein OmpA-like peptidoglycan-associated protein/anti-anti-sigma regulatory factor
MSLSLQSTNGVRIAVLDGTIDNSSGSDLVTTVKSSVEKASTIILDCTLVPSMDVAGFRHLLALHRWSQIGNGRLILAGMGPEAWALIVENHCENTFESSPSVAAAMQSVGIGSDELDSASSASQAVEKDYSVMNIPPPLPEGDSGIFSRGQGGTGSWMASGDGGGASSDWSTAPSPASTAGDDGWETFSKRPSNTLGEEEGTHHPQSRTPLYIAIAAAALVLIVGGLWLKSYLAPPVITVDNNSLELVEGEDVTGVVITVQNGLLDTDSIKLPDGINISEGTENEGAWVYELTGIATEVGERTVTLEAKRDSQAATPVSVSITVKEKPLQWVFSPPPMEELKPLDSGNYAKIVLGAQTLKLLWNGDDPGGLEVKNVAGTWRLVGTPKKGGNFVAEFHAEGKSGVPEIKNYEIQVKKAPQVVVSPVVLNATDEPQKDLAAVISGPGSGKAPPPPELKTAEAVKVEEPKAASLEDDRMRTFLMERIEKASSSRFSAFEKDKLRDIVKDLEQAQLIFTIDFKVNKSDVADSKAEKFKEALREPAIAKILDNPDCQIVVVGYASSDGSQAYNEKLSKERAKNVNNVLRRQIGRDSDLCGYYGPTDIISKERSGNRVVEVYAGILKIKTGKSIADDFINYFNKIYGAD